MDKKLSGFLINLSVVLFGLYWLYVAAQITPLFDQFVNIVRIVCK